jgi:hypothetical protein
MIKQLLARIKKSLLVTIITIDLRGMYYYLNIRESDLEYAHTEQIERIIEGSNQNIQKNYSIACSMGADKNPRFMRACERANRAHIDLCEYYAYERGNGKKESAYYAISDFRRLLKGVIKESKAREGL